jgi:hypothetical protein
MRESVIFMFSSFIKVPSCSVLSRSFIWVERRRREGRGGEKREEKREKRRRRDEKWRRGEEWRKDERDETRIEGKVRENRLTNVSRILLVTSRYSTASLLLNSSGVSRVSQLNSLKINDRSKHTSNYENRREVV